MSLHTKYNQENVFTRGVIAGVLNVFNNNITYNQIWGNSDIETINIPWYYNQSGDERFMQDFYTHYGDCLPPRKIDGNNDPIPRGVITYTGSNINSNRSTSRFVQGKYLKELNGKLESYVSYLYSIPIDITIDCELWIDKHLSAFKIEQEIREYFYKTITFYFYYKGLRLGAQVGFPENYTLTKNIQYSFESDNKIKLSFQIQVETYQPVFDKTTETLASNTMKNISYRISPNPETYDSDITLNSPSSNITIPKGIPLLLEWTYNKEESTFLKANIAWSLYNSNSLNVIENSIPNYEYYIWNIPDNFTGFKQPFITWKETEDVGILREPNIKIIPEVSTGRITENSFYIVDSGYFYTNTLQDSSVNIILEMIDTSTNVSYFTGDASIVLNIKNNTIDTSTTVFYIDPSIYVPNTVDYKEINLFIINSSNTNHFSVKHNIKIV